MPAQPESHGHRGCRGLRPENTLPAFLHALTLGTDVLEMDVVLSADGEVVVSHEPWMSAAICLTPDGHLIAQAEEKSHNLYQLPYAEIRRYDCGRLRHPAFPEQQPAPASKPLLGEVLAATEQAASTRKSPPVRYAVEVKSNPASDDVFHPQPAFFLSSVVAVLAAAGVLERTTLLAFDVRILQEAHARYPGLATCLLAEADEPWAAKLAQLGFRPSTFGPDYRAVTAPGVAALRHGFPGLRLVPWTVNEPATMRQLAAWGVDGITTDYPDRLRAVLRDAVFPVQEES